MTEKKISFSFKQVRKQPLLLPTKIGNDKKNDVELIQCLEGQTIKLIHEKEDEKPLVIPLLNSTRTSAALASLKNLKSVLDGEEQNETAISTQKTETKPTDGSGSLTIEQRVVKEILNEALNAGEENDEANGEKLTLPMVDGAKELLDGAKESSIDDYDDIPIAKFGMAMLRGMGLKDEEIKSKQNKDPELRPKGMGLGADKVVKKVKLLVAPSVNETLEIKKNAYVRILGGKHKDLYGQIEGLDDHACRVIVRLAVGSTREAFNEFMVQPVSKKEFQEYGKVINSAKYEEYKKKQEEKNREQSVKKEIRTESTKGRAASRERAEPSSRTQRESSPQRSRDKNEYESSCHQQERTTDRSKDRRRSPSYDRLRSRDRDSYRNQNESRSVDKYKQSTSYRRDRSRDRSVERSKDRVRERSRDKTTDDKHGRRSEKSTNQSSSDSDSSSSNDSRHEKRSHQKKSKKKHKKKSSKNCSDDEDRYHKKKTKKNKRERSRSRTRR